jgi:hypothetical protein
MTMNKFGKHKWWMLTALLSAPLVALAAGVPNMFAPNTPISSQQVNDNFTNLANRTTALEAQKTTISIPIDNVTGVAQPTTIIKTAMFTTTGGPVFLQVSGSGYISAATPPPPLMMDLAIQLDGNVIGHLKEYTNETGSHKAFPTRTFSAGTLTAGNHTVGLLQTAPMTSDINDFFTVTVTELAH